MFNLTHAFVLLVHVLHGVPNKMSDEELVFDPTPHYESTPTSRESSVETTVAHHDLADSPPFLYS